MFRTALLTLTLFASSTIFASSTGKIDGALWETLAPLAAQAPASAIVHLEAQADIPSLDRYLYKQKVTRAYRHRVVIDELRRVARDSQPAVRGELEKLQAAGMIDSYRAYWITNCFVVTGTKAGILRLAELPEIGVIEATFPGELIAPIESRPVRPGSLDENHGVTTGIRAIRADEVWHELGITGSGRLVANLDTGVDGAHPALASRWRGTTEPWYECWLDVVDENTTFPQDDPLQTHGTHTMGTMCGNSTVSNDSVGVAPGARWIAANGINQSAAGATEFTNDVLRVFEWIADPDSNSSTIDDVPDAINNSWGVSAAFPGFTDCYPNWNNAIANCEAAGVVVVMSAGNEGPGSESLRSPAEFAIDSVTHFAVAAVNADEDTIPPFDQIANFSSRGPTSCPDGSNISIKPEVAAPGVDVYSTIPGTSSDPNRYSRMSGTSMAAPHIAGVVALMREANPNAEVRDIKSVLMRTAIDVGDAGEDNTFGWGFVDAYAAVLEISANRGFIEGFVTDQATGNPVEGARIQAGNNTPQVTGPDGHYILSLPGDETWEVTASAYGYFSQVVEITLAVEDTVDQDFVLDGLPAGSLQGQLLAGMNIPVVNARVDFFGLPVDDLYTNEDGGFARTVPGDSTYTLRLTYHDALLETTFVVPVDGVVDLDLYLESIRSEPQGPDLHGYSGYDVFDSPLRAEHDWVEINPDLGGPGSGDLPANPPNDASALIDVPFPFIYYGETYDSLTINENGWLSPLPSNFGFFVNGHIPSSSGPSAMIAVFWDNLFHIGDARVCWYYDEPNGRLIVEYYRMAVNQSSQEVATFQIHIYDTAVRPTQTGDCEIVFLYEETGLSFSPTVGIENLEETIGLEMQYTSSFGQNTWQIVDGSALLFTTAALGTLEGTVICHPVPFDYSPGTISAGGVEVNLNPDGTYLMPNARAGTQQVTITYPAFETISQEVTVPVGESATADFEIWRLDPPQNLTAAEGPDYTADLQWVAPVSVEDGSLDEFVEYAVYEEEQLLGRTSDQFFGAGPYEVSAVHYYTVIAEYAGGESAPSNVDSVEIITSADSHPDGIPASFALYPAFPNPFNPATEIRYDVPEAARVSITVYNTLGQEVIRLLEGARAPGRYSVTWEGVDGAGMNVAAGMYLYQLRAGDFVDTRKMLLLK